MSQPLRQSAKLLLDELHSRGFTIQVAGEGIAVSPRSRLTDVDRNEIRKLKKPITALLSPCGPHLDPSVWERKPLDSRPGWERANCRRCGRFIGFNPLKESSLP